MVVASGTLSQTAAAGWLAGAKIGKYSREEEKEEE